MFSVLRNPKAPPTGSKELYITVAEKPCCPKNLMTLSRVFLTTVKEREGGEERDRKKENPVSGVAKVCVWVFLHLTKVHSV